VTARLIVFGLGSVFTVALLSTTWNWKLVLPKAFVETLNLTLLGATESPMFSAALVVALTSVPTLALGRLAMMTLWKPSPSMSLKP